MSEQGQDTTPKFETISVTMSERWDQRVADQAAKDLEELSPLNQYTIEVNGEEIVYKRRKILSKERKILEALRMTLAIEARRLNKNAVETEDKLYKKSAEFFLINSRTNNPMTAEEYEGTRFEDIKKIMDACTYRTEKPVPPLEG